jgi:hypothetical protein
MKKQSEVLARGVYVAPWMNPDTRRQEIVLIDCRGSCIHQISQDAGESEDQALARAQALLDLMDVRRP